MTEMIQHEQVKEGTTTRQIEVQTAKLQSINWLGFAVGSMFVSAALEFVFKKRVLGNFVGLWAPCFMLIGIYNKIVKVEANLERSLMH